MMTSSLRARLRVELIHHPSTRTLTPEQLDAVVTIVTTQVAQAVQTLLSTIAEYDAAAGRVGDLAAQYTYARCVNMIRTLLPVEEP